jgi:hypothetical protein
VLLQGVGNSVEGRLDCGTAAQRRGKSNPWPVPVRSPHTSMSKYLAAAAPVCGMRPLCGREQTGWWKLNTVLRVVLAHPVSLRSFNPD